MSLERVTQDLERELLNVFPEAEDFLRVVKENGKLNLVHIYDDGSSLCEPFHFVYGKKVWAIRELEPYSEGGDWKELGVALDRKEPAVYFNMRTMQMGIRMALALKTGFKLDRIKEHFDKLSLIFKKVFVEGKDAYYFNYGEEGSKLSLEVE